MAVLPETIEADGLVLRRWRVDHAEALCAAVEESAEHLRPWMPWMAEEPRSLAGRRELIAGWEREWEGDEDGVYGVFTGDAVAGGCGLHRRRGPGTLEIGYWTHARHLRQGVATRVAAALTATALAIPGIERVEIHHDKANEASAGIPRQLGFAFDGETRRPPRAPAETGLECTWLTGAGDLVPPVRD